MAKTPAQTQYPPAAEETGAGFAPREMALVSGHDLTNLCTMPKCTAAQPILGDMPVTAETQRFFNMSPAQAAAMGNAKTGETLTVQGRPMAALDTKKLAKSFKPGGCGMN